MLSPNCFERIPMYPYELAFGITLYEVFIVVGVLAGMLLYRRFSAKVGLSSKLHNLVLCSAVAAVVGGYLLAYVAQGFYNWMDGQPFELNEATGSTFLGGMLGGLGFFCAVYFGLGAIRFKEDREHIRRFSDVMDGMAIAVTLGHGFGRIGCLMAGCCYGITSEHGIYFQNLGYRALPTQLYEAVFLFVLCAVLWKVAEKKPGIAPAVYFISYGVWRFCLEFLRGDYRGKTVVDFLSPSQFISVLLVLAGIVMLTVRSAKKGGDADEA